MRISSSTIACLFLLLGGPQVVLAQDISGTKLLPPRAIPGGALPEPDDSVRVPGAAAIAPAPDTPTAHTALPLVPFTSARDALKAWMRDSTAGNTVSYTHLDVYKRQPRRSGRSRRWAGPTTRPS